MTRRLFLGTGPVARDLIGESPSSPGEWIVLTDDEHRLDTLRSSGVAVESGDPTSRARLEALDVDPATVLVDVGDGPADLAAARGAREAFPDAVLTVVAAREAAPSTATDLAAVADRVIDPSKEIAEHVLDRVGDEAVRMRQLRRVLREIDGRLAIVTHDNPDPDAIASAVALAGIAEAVGCEPEVCYYGEISHQENRAFVNLLDFDLVNLADGADVAEYDGVALVDHSRPGVNDGLPADTPIDVVVDHHPPRVPIEARFVDLRSGVGATSTLLVDYLRRFDAPLDETVATGLLFGIRVDTKEFRREVSPADFEAAAFLLPRADLGALERIEEPSVTAETLETVGRAIANRNQSGSVLLSCVGEVVDRDALAQAADRLLDLEGVNATLVYGVKGGTIYVSARARGTDLDLGETLRDAFGRIGSAGGHADMAGAQITLGVLESIEDRDASLHEVVRSVVDERFLEALESRSHRLLAGVYAPAEFEAETDGDAGDGADGSE